MTPLQEILKVEADLTLMFDSDERVAMALLEHIRTNRKEMLDKEKEQMCAFADEFAIECINFHHEKIMSPEKFFELTYGGNK